MAQYWVNVNKPLLQMLHLDEGCGDVRRKREGINRLVGQLGSAGGWLGYDSVADAVTSSTARKGFNPLFFCTNCQLGSPAFSVAARSLQGSGSAAFDVVLRDYHSARQTLQKVPRENANLAVAAIRIALPKLFQSVIDARGEKGKFQVTGSVGEAPLNMAAIPWVAVFRKAVTNGARRGYYVVLLFAEDGSSAVLTLNQGFHDFMAEFQNAAEKKARDCASLACEILEAPSGFTAGPIQLNATGTLGKGYQQGAIVSKTYRAGTQLSMEQFEADLHALLDTYDQLYRIAGSSLLALLPPASDQEFQEAVQTEAAGGANGSTPATAGPQPKPPATKRQGRISYVRDPKVGARALKMAAYVCTLSTVEAPHATFTTHRTNRQYVEAHHLVPISKQGQFEFSLDVEENIVALCPTCHRMVHHSRTQDKLIALKALLTSRQHQLAARGLMVDLPGLKALYSTLSDED